MISSLTSLSSPFLFLTFIEELSELLGATGSSKLTLYKNNFFREILKSDKALIQVSRNRFLKLGKRLQHFDPNLLNKIENSVSDRYPNYIPTFTFATTATRLTSGEIFSTTLEPTI